VEVQGSREGVDDEREGTGANNEAGGSQRRGAGQPREAFPTVATAPGPQSATGSKAEVPAEWDSRGREKRREGCKRGGRDPGEEGGFDEPSEISHGWTPRPNGGGAARATTGPHQCDQRGRPRAAGPAGEPDFRMSTDEYKLVIVITTSIKFPTYPTLLRKVTTTADKTNTTGDREHGLWIREYPPHTSEYFVGSMLGSM